MPAWVNASTDISRYRDISPRVSANLSAALDLRIQMGIAEAGAAYEVARFGLPLGPTTTIPVTFDVLAGARYWYQRFDFSFRLDRILDVNAVALRDAPPQLAGNPDLPSAAASGTATSKPMKPNNDPKANRANISQTGLSLTRRPMMRGAST